MWSRFARYGKKETADQNLVRGSIVYSTYPYPLGIERTRFLLLAAEDRVFRGLGDAKLHALFLGDLDGLTLALAELHDNRACWAFGENELADARDHERVPC